jgi:predicted permease
MANLLVVALCLLAGLALQRQAAFAHERAASTLNAFAIHVPLPALVLRQVSALSPSADVLLPALMPWALLLATAALVVALTRALGWSREVRGALLLVVPLGNTSFVGLPLTEAWLGPEAVPWAILYDQLGSFVALVTWGSWIVATHRAVIGPGGGQVSSAVGPDRTRPAGAPRAADIGRRIATFPPFIALILAVLIGLSGGLPAIAADALELLSRALVPSVLVAVGLQWRLALPAADRAPFAAALSLKVLVSPLVAWALVKALGAHGLAADATILEAGMGPMLTACALGVGAGLRPTLIAAVAGYGTLASLATTGLVRWTLLPV